jgi:hypothetical protein
LENIRTFDDTAYGFRCESGTRSSIFVPREEPDLMSMSAPIIRALLDTDEAEAGAGGNPADVEPDALIGNCQA